MERLLQNIKPLRLNHCYAELETLIQKKRAFLDQAKGNFLKFRKIVEKIHKVMRKKNEDPVG